MFLKTNLAEPTCSVESGDFCHDLSPQCCIQIAWQRLRVLRCLHIIPQKLRFWIPQGSVNRSTSQQKRRSAHSLGLAEDPWPALAHVCNKKFCRVASISMSICWSPSHSRFAREHSTAGCCPWHPLTAQAWRPFEHLCLSVFCSNLHGLATLEFETYIESKLFVFFRPTPSWLLPGRPTRSIACCKLGRMVNWCKHESKLSKLFVLLQFSIPVRPVWKSAVHRSAVRSNASTKFLQNYAGRRVRQPRTPNTSAERKFTNLIKLKQCRVKKTVSPSTHTCWRQASSFRSRRNTLSRRETQTQQTRKRKSNKGDVFPLLICLMSSYVTQQLLFIKWTSDTSPSSRCLNW